MPGFHAKSGTDFTAKIASCPTDGFETDGFVQRTSGQFIYDANGNLTFDPYKGMSISYNYLNLPYKVDFGTGKEIHWLYDATGTKLQKTIHKGGIMVAKQDYLAGIEYKNDSLQAVYHKDGRAVLNNGVFEYEYYLSDHLGNNRVLFSDSNGDGQIDVNTEVLQENHYYPFGLEMKGDFMQNEGREEKYLFGSKELQDEFGIDIYDFVNRQYDPAIGRFLQIDPLGEKRNWITPYNYVQNNPILRIDPNGLTDFKFDKKTGEVTQVGEKNDQPDRILRTDRKGNVKRKGEGIFGFLTKKSERGKAKVELDGIEQGILSDGMNLKTENNIIEVGGEGQATVEGFEDFALRFSDYIGREVAGGYFSEQNKSEISQITIGKYINNGPQSAKAAGLTLGIKAGLKLQVHYHTHLSHFRDSDRLHPSNRDLEIKDARTDPDVKFIIITKPKSFNYTTGFFRRH
jgi:RHS repeat-associated protein